MPCSGIRTHDLRVRASEESSCLLDRGAIVIGPTEYSLFVIVITKGNLISGQNGATFTTSCHLTDLSHSCRHLSSQANPIESRAKYAPPPSTDCFHKLVLPPGFSRETVCQRYRHLCLHLNVLRRTVTHAY
jgi:hypothetical protein